MNQMQDNRRAMLRTSIHGLAGVALSSLLSKEAVSYTHLRAHETLR